MVRTGDRCVRVGGGKSSSKKSGGGASSSSTPKSKASSGKSCSSIGGNPVCPRETPEWQKPITNFFTKLASAESSSVRSEESAEQGTSYSEASSSKYTSKQLENSDESIKEPESLGNIDTTGLTMEEIEILCALRNPRSSDQEDSLDYSIKSVSQIQTESSLSPEPEEDGSSEPEEDGSPEPEEDGSPEPEEDGSPEPEEDGSPEPEEDGSPEPEEDGIYFEYIGENETSTSERKCEPIPDSPESPDFEPFDGITDSSNTPVKILKLEENIHENNNRNEEECKTPTAEKKRKSTINILTPKRINSHY